MCVRPDGLFVIYTREVTLCSVAGLCGGVSVREASGKTNGLNRTLFIQIKYGSIDYAIYL